MIEEEGLTDEEANEIITEASHRILPAMNVFVESFASAMEFAIQNGIEYSVEGLSTTLRTLLSNLENFCLVEMCRRDEDLRDELEERLAEQGYPADKIEELLDTGSVQEREPVKLTCLSTKELN